RPAGHRDGAAQSGDVPYQTDLQQYRRALSPPTPVLRRAHTRFEPGPSANVASVARMEAHSAEIRDRLVRDPALRHSASVRAFTPVFDGLWTRVNAPMAPCGPRL